MAVARKRPKMRRTQISLSQEEYETAKRVAASRRISVSQYVREALRHEEEAERLRRDPLRGIIGICKEGDPRGSVTIDEVLYGEGIP